MTGKAQDKEIGLLLCLMDEAYEKKAWHGPNLKGAIRGLTAQMAAARPASARHSIWEIVLHAAYWKYAVRRRLRQEKRGSFSLPGSNWFKVPEEVSERDWKVAVSLLEREHRLLRETVVNFPPKKLGLTLPHSKVDNARLIYGIASHDLYHAGQIQLLKRLVKPS
jgi:hypothetical protein